MNTDINYILDNIKFNYHHRKTWFMQYIIKWFLD